MFTHSISCLYVTHLYMICLLWLLMNFLWFELSWLETHFWFLITAQHLIDSELESVCIAKDRGKRWAHKGWSCSGQELSWAGQKQRANNKLKGMKYELNNNKRGQRIKKRVLCICVCVCAHFNCLKVKIRFCGKAESKEIAKKRTCNREWCAKSK